MANDQQSGQTQNQGQAQDQVKPQQVTLDQLLQGQDKRIEGQGIKSDPHHQQVTLDQLLQGQNKSIEIEVIESDRQQERRGHDINEAHFEEGSN